MKKFLSIYSNPTIFLLILTLGFAIVLFVHTGFHQPELYVDKQLLESFWSLTYTVNSSFKYIEAGYYNSNYEFQNMLFRIFGMLLACLLFTFGLKVKSWNGYKNLPVIKNKVFIYTWINFFGILIVILKAGVVCVLADNYMSAPFDHSSGLAVMFIIAMTILFLIIYVLFVNLFFFFTYNNGLSNKLLKTFYILGIIFVFVGMIIMNSSEFSWFYVLFNLSDMVWIYLLLSAISVNDKKDCLC